MNSKSIFSITIIVALLVGFFWILPEPGKPGSLSEMDSESNEASPDDSGLSITNKWDVSKDFIIRNVDLYDGEKLQRNVDVRVVNQKISEVDNNIQNDSNLTEIDGNNLFLIPGLIDAHTHSWGEALSEALNFGITTELDMFTMPSFFQKHKKLRNTIDNTKQADLFSATILATAPKGHGTEYGFDIPVLENIEQVSGFVNQRVADGADYIKAVYSSKKSKRKHFPSISLQILEALATEASMHNKILVVHVDDLISAKEAIAAGAKGLVHSFMDKEVDSDFVKLMKDNQAFIIPTLQVEASITGLNPGANIIADEKMISFLSRQQRAQLKAKFNDFGIPEDAYKRAQKSVKLLADNGVVIMAGSDAPNPGTSHGASLHAELLSLVESGLSNEQALHAATGALAKSFGYSDRGVIKKGVAASMVLLGSDPLENIRATRDIVAIWKNGVFFERLNDELNTESAYEIEAGVISDFEEVSDESQNIETAIGAGISPTTDKFANGASEVSFSLVKAADGNKSLIVSGEIKSGFAFPWSGLAYLPGKDFTTGGNLSKLKSFNFEIQDLENTETIEVMLFQQGSFQPVSKKIPLDKELKQVKLKLSEFNGVDLTLVNNISIVATGKARKFSFMLDNIRFE